jgi:stage V sporulation protein AC
VYKFSVGIFCFFIYDFWFFKLEFVFFKTKQHTLIKISKREVNWKVDNLKKQKEYNEYVTKKAPKTPMLKSLIWAFVIGGVICIIGQLIHDGIVTMFPELYETDVNMWTLITIIFITTLLTGIGIWDEVGYLGGAGAFIPITGFANAVASPAIEFKKEGYIFGLCVKMFVVAGPIIVNGILISVIAGLFYYIF